MLYRCSFKEKTFLVFILRMVCVFVQIYLNVGMYVLHIYLFEVTVNAGLGSGVESSAVFMFWEESIFIFRVVQEK